MMILRCPPSQEARTTAHPDAPASLWTLTTAKVLIWIASAGRDAMLTEEAHLFFFDRYRRLADLHRARGRTQRARRLADKAEEHYRAAGGDGPPYTAAMALPRPRRFVTTVAVSRTTLGPPDDAA